uniref:Uncharacterized protein n=1 Tax=Arundo donax TaxID=35708 RepID=A0A0A9BU97_ARUDO
MPLQFGHENNYNDPSLFFPLINDRTSWICSMLRIIEGASCLKAMDLSDALRINGFSCSASYSCDGHD